MSDEPTIGELRRVGRWLASIGYYAAAGQCHRRAWQREQLDDAETLDSDRRFGQPHHGHPDDAETLDTIPNRPAK